MTLLFNRAWSLDIVPPGRTEGVRYTNTGDFANNLRLQFDIERTLASTANKGKFQLTNLTADNRSNLAQGSVVILRAGYVGATGIVFQGYVKKVESTQAGQDVVTTIECGDGEPFITYGHVHLSYAKTVSLAQVLQDVAKTLKVTLGGQVYEVAGHVIQGIPNVTFPRLSKSGKTKKVLDDLLLPRGLHWSIQCGNLLIQNAKGVVNLFAEVLSIDTGMLDSPSRSTTGVKVKSLLNPRLVPGAAIRVVSANAACNGDFRAIKCTYKGDSEGGEWSVDIEGQPLLAPLAPVPTTQKKDQFQQSVYEDSEEPEDVEE